MRRNYNFPPISRQQLVLKEADLLQSERCAQGELRLSPCATVQRSKRWRLVAMKIWLPSEKWNHLQLQRHLNWKFSGPTQDLGGSAVTPALNSRIGRRNSSAAKGRLTLGPFWTGASVTQWRPLTIRPFPSAPGSLRGSITPKLSSCSNLRWT